PTEPVNRRERAPEVIGVSFERHIPCDKVSETDAWPEEHRIIHFRTCEIHFISADCRENGAENKQQQKSHRGGFSSRTAECGETYAKRKREEKRVDCNKSHAPKFAESDAAHQQRHAKDRQNRQDSIKRVDGVRAHFPDDDVVAFEVRQEKKTECAFAFFAA